MFRRLAAALACSLFVLVAPAHAVLHVEGLHKPTGSRDVREGRVAPLAQATGLVAANNWTARWNRFGTVHVLHNPGGFLATGLTGAPDVAARAWIRTNRSLFRLSEASVDALKISRSEPLNQSNAHFVEFRQWADGAPVAYEGRIKIGIVDGKLFWVASSSIGDVGTLAPVAITPAQAWLAAAARVPLGVPVPTLVPQGTSNGWTLFDAAGYTGAQRVRSVVLGRPGVAAVPAFEANVVRNADNGHLVGYTAYVNALDGSVLVLQDRVQQLDKTEARVAPKADRAEQFAGDYPPSQSAMCGPCHGPFTVGPGEIFVRMVASATSANPANDIYIDIYRDDAACANNAAIVAHGDSGTSPEAAVYQPAGGVVPPGSYFVEVCPFSALQLPPTNYAGSVVLQETQSPVATSSNPQWAQFPVTPANDHSNMDTRTTGCWFRTKPDGSSIAECDEQLVDGSSHNIPWDYIGNAPSETTSGNNARAYEGWNAAIGGASPYQPAADTERTYIYPWANTWFTSSCSPAVVTHATPEANDIDAAIGNLFVLHNRLHDFAYHLGLRERTGVAQTSNYGQTEVNREGDAELGFAQAGASTGGFPSYLGRDNANQLTLQDGVAPLSNMYLWQTIGGAIYTPCVDGDFDGQIIAHEYGHLVQNRMTDIDSGLSGVHGRAMGEGWADLNAVMLFDELGLLPDNDPSLFSVGAYVAGDVAKGIRNYAISDSPLNLGSMGYDTSCESPITNVEGTCEAAAEVHSDAEIWTAAHYEIRASLVAKYDALGFDSSNVTLKRRCANGEVAADACPGSRRWSQLVHDGMLLQPSTPTMIDARDAILAADVARDADAGSTWISNQPELWAAFARRGLGQGASAIDGEDADPVPAFASPHAQNATVTFDVRDGNGAPVDAMVYVGHYEGRATASADTIAASPLAAAVTLQPGTYEFYVRAPGFGHTRLTRTVNGSETLQLRLARNHAAAAAGAVATGAGEQHGELIDETEGTSWRALAQTPSIDVVQPAVTVQLAGGVQTINRVQVSGALEVVVGATLESRYTSVHQFAIAVCNQTSADCSNAANYTTVLTSPDGAFPSADLRPLGPDMMLREFRFAPAAATHVRFTVLHNKCTGTPKYHGYLGVPNQKDADPANNTDCRLANGDFPERDVDVRAAELQVFSADSTVVDSLFGDGFE